MKRIILSVLVLIGVWRLLELSSINAAFFAFLTLGINPLTNHPFSTPSLISILFAVSLASILLLFNRALMDFFGGLADWLRRTDHMYGETKEGPADVPSASMASLPVRAAIQDLAEPQSALEAFAANLQLLPKPTLGLPHAQAYIGRLSRRYGRLIRSARLRLQTIKTSQERTPQTVLRPQKPDYKAGLTPELAEVVAIFEQMAREAEASEPQEAVVVEPKAATVSPRSILRSHLENALGHVKHTLLLDATRASNASKAAEQRAGAAAHTVDKLARRAAVALYRYALLATLILLIGGGFVLHVLNAALRAIGHGMASTYRHVCRGIVFSAMSITLGLFALGRGIKSGLSAIGHGLAMLCRGIYKLAAGGIMLAFLGAGYTLLVFSLLCFIAWELFEPYARKLDKWLGDTVGDTESFAEMAKVGHEMSRTFAGWYRSLRDIKRSTLN